MSSLGDKARGVGEGLKGNVKEGLGKATGDRKLEVEGKADKARGAADEKMGEVKETVRKHTP